MFAKDSPLIASNIPKGKRRTSYVHAKKTFTFSSTKTRGGEISTRLWWSLSKLDRRFQQATYVMYMTRAMNATMMERIQRGKFLAVKIDMLDRDTSIA